MKAIDGKTAKRYARALFELTSPDALEEMRDALESFASTWEENAELKASLVNPSTPEQEKIAVIQDMASMISSGNQNLSNFLCLLLTNGRLGGVSEIHEYFSEMVNELKNFLSMEVMSAFPVPDSEKQAIAQKVQSEYGAMASIDWKEDRALIGGLRIKAGDRLLDSSVLGSLEKVRSRLTA